MSTSEVFNIDNMEYMKNIKDNYFELAICDPEYGIHDKLLRKGKTGKLHDRALAKYEEKQWDRKIPEKEYFDELFRISKNQIIWGGNYFIEHLNNTRGVICWDKMQPWENFSAWEMAWTSFDVVARIFKFDNRTGGKIHPTQKPVALYKWLLTNYAKPNDKIFDSHLGSGSSRIAAYELGFDFTGLELDKDYFNDGNKRFMEFKKKFHNEFYIPDEENLLFKKI